MAYTILFNRVVPVAGIRINCENLHKLSLRIIRWVYRMGYFQYKHPSYLNESQLGSARLDNYKIKISDLENLSQEDFDHLYEVWRNQSTDSDH